MPAEFDGRKYGALIVQQVKMNATDGRNVGGEWTPRELSAILDVTTAAAPFDDAALRHCKLFTAGQTAELLQVDRSTIWRLTQRIDNPLPCVRFGERITRFRLTDVESFIANSGGRE